jgi:mRNA-degrading endonuclease RelE of RelBE toxin-antitoxin system
VKRIAFSEQAKAEIRAIPQQTAMQILTAIHRLAETGVGRVKTLQGQRGEKRLRVGDFRLRFTEESGQEESGQEESGEAGQGRKNEGVLHIHSVRNRKQAYR